MAITSIFLAGKFHRQRSMVGYSPWGCKESDTTEQLSTYAHAHVYAHTHTHTHTHTISKGQRKNLQLSAFYNKFSKKEVRGLFSGVGQRK